MCLEQGWGAAGECATSGSWGGDSVRLVCPHHLGCRGTEGQACVNNSSGTLCCLTQLSPGLEAPQSAGSDVGTGTEGCTGGKRLSGEKGERDSKPERSADGGPCPWTCARAHNAWRWESQVRRARTAPHRVTCPCTPPPPVKTPMEALSGFALQAGVGTVGYWKGDQTMEGPLQELAAPHRFASGALIQPNPTGGGAGNEGPGHWLSSD